MSKIENYIFDLDGTLVDSREDILECIKIACSEFIDTSSLDNVVIGKPIKDILSPYFQDAEILNQVIKRFRETYDNMEYKYTYLYPNVLETLQELKNNGKSIYILTNKPSKPTTRILDKFEINSYFDAIYTINSFDNTTKNKVDRLKHIITTHNLKPTETVYIGDTLEDVIAAKDNAVTSIAAIWGYGNNKERIMSEADFYLETLDFQGFEDLMTKLNALLKI